MSKGKHFFPEPLVSWPKAGPQSEGTERQEAWTLP